MKAQDIGKVSQLSFLLFCCNCSSNNNNYYRCCPYSYSYSYSYYYDDYYYSYSYYYYYYYYDYDYYYYNYPNSFGGFDSVHFPPIIQLLGGIKFIVSDRTLHSQVNIRPLFVSRRPDKAPHS